MAQKKSKTGARPRARAGLARAAHAAADMTSQELANFNPPLRSADAAYLPERRAITARIQDLVRNDGWTSSTLTRYVDQAIGAQFRVSYRPDWQALGLSFEAGAEFSEQVETAFRQYANDPRFYVDAAEQLNFAGLVGLAFRHRMGDGEAIAMMQWINRPWFKSRTAVQIIAPQRLSNPNDTADTDTLRDGVERNALGAPQAYWFRTTHPGDQLFGQSDQYKWVRVSRRTPWGRPIVIHQFEPDQAGATRGKSGLATVVSKVFMTNKYAAAEMQAAVLNAVLAAYIESPLDHESLAEGLSDSKGSDGIDAYNNSRLDYHEKNRVTLGGVKLPFLYPGEKIGMVDATRPNANYAEFEERALRYIAAATGQSYEQLAADYSKTNYSSVRAAMLDAWKFLSARRDAFGNHFCTPIFAAWLEDAVDLGVVKLPAGAPAFWEAYAAYTQCDWIGPARGWVDPTKEAEASVLRMGANISTLERESAEAGTDWRRNLQQRALEQRELKKLGLQDADLNTVTPSASNDELDDEGDAERDSASGTARDRGNV